MNSTHTILVSSDTPIPFNARRIDPELQAAREIQNRFLPGRLPQIGGLDYHGDCRPTGDLGGDFFDFRSLPENGLAVSVGDISGHGVSAAILMSGIQSFLRGFAVRDAAGIASSVEELNRIFCEVSPDNFYATLFLACVKPARREIRYVSAGHEPPLLLRKRAGRVERLESTGTVLGLTGRSVFDERTVLVEPGDILVAFTDGITEATDGQGREFGAGAIGNILRRCDGERASELVAKIFEAVDVFADPFGPRDDRTVAALQFTGAMERTLQEEECVKDETEELAFAAA